MFGRRKKLTDRLAQDWRGTTREELGRARTQLARGKKRLAKELPPARRKRRTRRRVAAVAGAAAVGAAGSFLLDPSMGRTRRARLKDQTMGLARTIAGRGRRLGRRTASDARGMLERARHQEDTYRAPNDITLAHKVESEVFGRPDVPKGSIVVNVEHGVVVLRGQLEDEEAIRGLESAVRDLPGVDEVENLIHLPGQLPPNKAASMRRGS